MPNLSVRLTGLRKGVFVIDDPQENGTIELMNVCVGLKPFTSKFMANLGNRFHLPGGEGDWKETRRGRPR